MKLHLPKLLLTAVLAVVGTGYAQAMSVTYDYTNGTWVEFSTGNPAANANPVYQGLAIAWNDGILKNVDFSKNLSFDLTLNWGDTSATLITTQLSNGTKWGYTTAAGGSIEEQWNNGVWSDSNKTDDDNTITSDQLSALDTDGNNSVKLTVLINGTGTYMKAPETETTWNLDNSPNLKVSSGNLSHVNINKTYISKVYAYDAGSATFTAGDWNKTYSRDEVINATVNRIEIRGLADGTTKTVDGATVGADKDIVVGGTGQLFLQTWHSGGNINVLSDIILGGSTHSDYNGYGAIRFGNDKTAYSTNLQGAIKLVEDSKIISNSTGTISITGGITGDHDLIVGGAGYAFSGEKIAISSLLLEKGKVTGEGATGSMTFSNEVTVAGLTVATDTTATFNNKLTIGSTIINNGVLSLNGQLAIDNLNSLTSEYYTTGGDTNGLSSYGHIYHLVSGTGTLSGSTTQITYDGKDYNIADGIKIEGGSAYVVATDTVQVGGDNAAADTKGAGKFIVHDGATLQLNTREADAALSADALITTTEGEGIIDLHTTATIGKNAETKFNGILKVSEGGILQVCQTDYKGPGEGYSATPSDSADLSSLTAIELAGGELRHASDTMSLGNIRVTADSKLNVFDIATDDSAITINRLDLGAELDVIGRWKSNTIINTLSGAGTLDVAAPAETGASKKLTIKATDNFTGKINQTGGIIKATAGLTIGEITQTGGIIEATAGLTIGEITQTGGTLKLTTGTTTITKGMDVQAIDATGLQQLVLGTREGNSTTETYKIGQLTGNTAGLNLEVNEGTLELGAQKTNSVHLLDLSAANKSDAAVTVKNGGTLNITNSLWMSNRDANKINLEESAQLNATYNVGSNHQINIKGKEGGATLTTSADDQYDFAKTSYTISNADVTITDNNSAASVTEVTLSNVLDGSSLTNSSTKTLKTTNGYSNFTAIDAKSGDINMTYFNQQGNQGTLESLNIGNDRTIGLYKAGVPATPGTANEMSVTTQALTVGTNATLNANLVLAHGATVKMAEALTMGSTLRLGTNMTLSGDLVSTIKTMSEDGIVDLFTGVDALYLGDSTVASGALDATSGEYLKMYFNFDDQRDYYLGYGGGKVYAGVISVPEPTTATLSLLALAALASRRRRK